MYANLRYLPFIRLPLMHAEAFERLGQDCPKGLLLHGPAGCGKALAVRAVALKSGATLLEV